MRGQGTAEEDPRFAQSSWAVAAILTCSHCRAPIKSRVPSRGRSHDPAYIITLSLNSWNPRLQKSAASVANRTRDSDSITSRNRFWSRGEGCKRPCVGEQPRPDLGSQRLAPCGGRRPPSLLTELIRANPWLFLGRGGEVWAGQVQGLRPAGRVPGLAREQLGVDHRRIRKDCRG